jgi:hypothetical protein
MHVARERVQTCWKLTRSSPWQHQLFVFLILLQTVYLIAERVAILAVYSNFQEIQEARASEWFAGIIIIAVIFVAYYAINAILTANVVEIVVFRLLSLWLLLRVYISYGLATVSAAGATLVHCEKRSAIRPPALHGSICRTTAMRTRLHSVSASSS